MTQYRALVVDDEAMVRQATMRALSRENFICDAAADGREALEIVNRAQFEYDLVVTDLRMPEKNGHSLAVDLLNRPRRPVVAVLTGVIEPKLANDLVVRGIDELMYKPVQYPVMAGKMRQLVERKATERLAVKVKPATDAIAAQATNEPVAQDSPATGAAAELAPIETKLRVTADLLPQPPALFDAFMAASSNQFGTSEVSTAVQLAPHVVVEVLRLANGMVYGSHQKISQLERSVDALRRTQAKPYFIWMIGSILFIGGLLTGLLCAWLLSR